MGLVEWMIQKKTTLLPLERIQRKTMETVAVVNRSTVLLEKDR